MQINKRTTLYTTGAIIAPIEVDIDGKKYWRWVVDRFEDDTYYDGEVANVNEYADTINQLIEEDENE